MCKQRNRAKKACIKQESLFLSLSYRSIKDRSNIGVCIVYTVQARGYDRYTALSVSVYNTREEEYGEEGAARSTRLESENSKDRLYRVSMYNMYVQLYSRLSAIG